MKRWQKDIDAQRALQGTHRARNHSTSDQDFIYMRSVANMPNPYQQEYETEEETTSQSATFSEFPVSRTTSSTSLSRARSGTNGSGGSGHMSVGRPSRFPMPEPPISLHTQLSNGSLSPSERERNGSYFSPVTEIPSTRSSSQSAFPYPRQNTPSNAWEAESNRYTAPASSRGASRDGPHNPYFSGTTSSRSQRPSLPPPPNQHISQPPPVSQQRMRSASSPDIHHHNPAKFMNGHATQAADNVPVPPIPPQLASMRALVNRSQNNSPTNGHLPSRPTTQNGGFRHGGHGTMFHDVSYPDRSATTTPGQSSFTDHGMSESMISEPEPLEPYMPTQIKARVNFDDNYVTLVIASNILFRSLTDRVDAKLARFTNQSIGSKSIRLRYKDEDGDFVTIDSDEAVQLAFMEWRDQNQDNLAHGQVGEIQLYCQVVEN